jgi:hypothetical protein
MALDLNAETYPYEIVQHLLDQTATFTLYAKPLPRLFETATILRDPDDFFGINGGYGLSLGCSLHAFESTTLVRDVRTVSVDQTVGCPVGEFRSVLRFGPAVGDDIRRWAPATEPPVMIYDRWRSQACVLTDATLSFGYGEQFRAYGIGRTYPVFAGTGPRLLLGAVGNLVDGDGLFRNHEASFSLCGTLSAELGFEGVIVCRVVDSRGDFASELEPTDLESTTLPSDDDTFIVLRGQKRDRTVKTTFGPKPGPNLDSLVTPSEMRLVEYLAPCDGRPPLSSMRVGRLVARMDADVRFNISAPPGTALTPTPFTTAEVYDFVDPCGRSVARIDAGVTDGIAFGLRFPSAPGQPGVRFAGFGPVTGGTGAFTGVQGLLTVNSVIGIAPHALSLTHVLHLVDPAGRWCGVGTDT